MISPVLQALAFTTCLQDQAVVPPAPAPVMTSTPAPTPVAAPPSSPSVAAPPSSEPVVVATPLAPSGPSSDATPTAPPDPSPSPYAAFPDSAATYPPPAPPRRSRFVFAAMPSLVFGINAEMIPSANLALYFGGRLRNPKWSLGYQFSGSIGFAERYWLGLVAHRHHITALTNFGARGFATIGGGLGFLLFYPALVEVETRVGVRLGARKRMVLGGQVRLGHNFLYREKAPLPQFGAFFGVSLF